MRKSTTGRKLLWIAVVFLAIWALPAAALARDYVVTFVKETYKTGEAAEAESPPRIYHTWSVKTEFGNKLLVLTGEDSVRRGWLREFIKDFDRFLVKVPDEDTGAFELNTVVEIDVDNLYPVDSGFIDADTGGKRKKKKKK